MSLLIDFTDCPQDTLDERERYIKEQLLTRSSDVGPFVTAFVHSLWIDGVISIREHAHALFCLAKHYGPERTEAACRRAMFYRRADYITVERILRRRAETLALDPYCDVYGNPTPWPSDGLDECGVSNNR
jgi:hypothetical protein